MHAENQPYTLKPWGWSEPVLFTADLELHYCGGVDGGYCSEHYHGGKYNRFWILSGRLSVNVGITRVELTAGSVLTVPPMILHQFFVLESCTFWEIYWPAPGRLLEPDDIVRSTVNGRHDQSINRH